MNRHRYQLINQVFEKLNLERVVNRKLPQTKLTKQPLIIVARDSGSGGHPIAKLTAKKLNFNFYDDKLVEPISKSAKKRTQIIKNVDERSRTNIQDMVYSLFSPEYISDTAYIKHLTNVVLSIAHQDQAVILGRGANFIVPQTDSFNVLITAPLKTRVKRAIKYEKIDIKQARTRIEKTTKERKKFVSQYFNKDYTNNDYYDLVLNTKSYDLNSASDLIIYAFRKKFLNIRLKTQYMNLLLKNYLNPTPVGIASDADLFTGK